MRQKLIGSAAALGLVAGALLGLLGWILFAVLMSMAAMGMFVLAAEAVRPIIQARRQAALEDPRPTDWWGFAGPSRID